MRPPVAPPADTRAGARTAESAEGERLEVQARLERDKGRKERNPNGQFATPPALASDVLAYARKLLPTRCEDGLRFLDPAFGTGSFYAALLKEFGREGIASAAGYEVDPVYGREAARLWEPFGLRLAVEDFTRATPPGEDAEKPNLLVCNPPYVRHHHLTKAEKERLRSTCEAASGVRPNGYAGLYCHFMLLSHPWMARGGLAAWLVPSEFMDVGYGKALKEYLLGKVTLLRVHRFRPQDAQFADALVSSVVMWFRNDPPPALHEVEFALGGTLSRPEVSASVPSSTLGKSAKWTGFPLATTAPPALEGAARLKDLFDVKRGLATGANEFFIMTPERACEVGLPERFLRPILPSPRYLETDEVGADEAGAPLIERRRVLLSCDLPEEEVRADYPRLWRYLREGMEAGFHERHLCRHRTPWYSQESRPPAPLLCTYMGRRGKAGEGRPFRFVLNRSRATAPNVYLMLYPKPPLQRALAAEPKLLEEMWEGLNALDPESLSAEGRVYGGGLHKLEPKELGNLPTEALADAIPVLGAETPEQEPRTLFGNDG